MCPRFWSRLLPLPGEAIRDFIGRCRHPFSGFHVVVTTDDVIIFFFSLICVLLLLRRTSRSEKTRSANARPQHRKLGSSPLFAERLISTSENLLSLLTNDVLTNCVTLYGYFFLSPNWLLLNCQTSTSPLRMKLCLLSLCESESGITGVRTRLIHRGGSMGF